MFPQFIAGIPSGHLNNWPDSISFPKNSIKWKKSSIGWKKVPSNGILIPQAGIFPVFGTCGTAVRDTLGDIDRKIKN